ncbi:MAG: YfhO family protein [Clostridia bacterium]|nr:YfhO family protein [Clostridia bacterium]
MRTCVVPETTARRLSRLCRLLVLFLTLAVGGFYILHALHRPEGTLWQQALYTIGGAVLPAALLTATAAFWTQPLQRAVPTWLCPAVAAGISLYLFCMAYIYLGVWPVGHKSVMLVDMHHQYAPLLNELRSLFIEGSLSSYSFHLGLGANFIPTFAYYLASPLNILLVLFPENYLTEGILVITLLKIAAAGAAFAACAQYLYRRRNAAVVATGVLYALTMYMLAYSWNIMWLDVVALLPVVVVCLEHMLRTEKRLPYILTLALALFANYYIGFMLCVFLVLYMAVWLVREQRPLRDNLLAGGRFALSSLLAGGLVAMLLWPTALALGRTSAAGGEWPSFTSNFPLFDFFGQLFYGSEPTIRSGNLPNLYCGIPAVLLLPIYFTGQHTPLRRRLCAGGLLAILLLSCTINQWDLVWHGLHTPNDLPYRFSFLVTFVLLLIAAHTLTHLAHVKPRQILYSLSACCVYLILWEKWGGDSAPTPTILYGNLLLLGVYAAILLAVALHKVPHRVGALLLLTVVCVELLLGCANTLMRMDANEYYTNHSDYVDNTDTAATAAALRRAEQLAAAEEQVFCRIEYLPRSTCMDTALHHYNGITTFASSNPYTTTQFMGHLGYAINGVNSYLYHSFAAVPDSLLGVRYVVLNSHIANHPQLQFVDAIAVGGYTRYIYRNTLALPVGFCTSQDVLEYHGIDNAPFLSQQHLYNTMTGEQSALYTALEMQATGDSSITGSAFAKAASEQIGHFSATVDQAGQYFAFVDCRAAENITLSAYSQDGDTLNNWGVTPYEPYVIDMGSMQPGETVDVAIESDGSVSGNIYVVRMDTAVLQQKIDKLAAGGLQITEQSANSLTGTVNAAQDSVLFFSIPYDAGWQVEIDGEKVQTLPVDRTVEGDDGAMLAVRMPAGQHTVRLRFAAPGQTLGWLMSLCSLLCVAAPYVWRRFKTRRSAQIPGDTQ